MIVVDSSVLIAILEEESDAVKRLEPRRSTVWGHNRPSTLKCSWPELCSMLPRANPAVRNYVGATSGTCRGTRSNSRAKGSSRR